MWKTLLPCERGPKRSLERRPRLARDQAEALRLGLPGERDQASASRLAPARLQLALAEDQADLERRGHEAGLLGLRERRIEALHCFVGMTGRGADASSGQGHHQAGCEALALLVQLLGPAESVLGLAQLALIEQAPGKDDLGGSLVVGLPLPCEGFR